MASGAVVELSTGQKVTTDATGRALFMVAPIPGAMTAKLFGQETTASSIVMAAPFLPGQVPTIGDATQPNQQRYPGGLQVEPAPDSARLPFETQGKQVEPTPGKISYPKFLTLHDRFAIEGTGFNGRADGNRVLLEGQPCLVLASSPLSLVVLPGVHVPIGPIGLKITVGGNDVGPLPVSAVLLEFSGPSETPNAGTQSSLVLHARGTTEPLSVEVRNGSPGVIQFPHGVVQRLTTSGGEENTAPVELKFLTAGSYTVTARLLAAGTGSSAETK